MRILLTNDDGIHAPGFQVLEEIARQLSDDVWVVAPLEEQSGAGHSLSLSHPVRVQRFGERRFGVRGTPTDCVMMAIGRLIEGPKPDLILSGVNRGANLAEDVTYSGTVSAAMEGTLAGVRSVALSQATIERPVGTEAFAAARAHAVPVLKTLLAAGWPENVLININFPPCPAEEVRGVRVTEQGFRDYGQPLIEERVDVRGFTYYWFGLGREISEPGHETDLKAVRERFVSVTPLHLDLTHRGSMAALTNAFAQRNG
ncbi:5'/3'-nucleotidase SurE [Pedomonas sp. V897]|uniref:5'/3'-nucleotidase SurE n=1 Tax=Pedomonas sp. V897 TaxID=3446482 RepID=UPI003EE29A1B